MPAQEQVKDRKTTRATKVVEIELRSPFKFTKTPKAAPQQEEPLKISGGSAQAPASEQEAAAAPVAMEKYTVLKNDTLQKISQKFYGTTKKWTRIFDANKEVLKAPNKIYPGQVINVPLDDIQEPKENLK
jgi:nucleoid-associated protein YgaU